MPAFILIQKPGGSNFISGLGWGDMVFSFFSTVSYRLEGPGNWGARFPQLLLNLCDQGVVTFENLNQLDLEVGTIYRELQRFSVSAAIYDISNPTLPIPWEQIPGTENNNLADPWITPRDGRSYFNIFADYIKRARQYNSFISLLFMPEIAERSNVGKPRKKGREYWLQDRDPISIEKLEKSGSSAQKSEISPTLQKKWLGPSKDYNIYMDDLNGFSKEGFEEYCKKYGFHIKAHPEITLFAGSGFVPFKVEGDFLNATIKNRYYLTGFEMYTNKNEMDSALSKKQNIFSFLRKGANNDNILNCSQYVVTMRCNPQDSLETLMAHLFGAFLCSSSNGTFYDPQEGTQCKSHKELLSRIQQIISGLQNLYLDGNILLHEFDEWN